MRHIEPLSRADLQAFYSRQDGLVLVEREFPDWVFRSGDTHIVAMSADCILDDVLKGLVALLARVPGATLDYIDTNLGVKGGVPSKSRHAPKSFRVASTATWDEVRAVLDGRDIRFADRSSSVIGIHDFIVVAPWCEIRVFMPDFAFIGIHPSAPAAILEIFAPYAWDVDGLLAEVGLSWWTPDASGSQPKEQDLRDAVPAALSATIRANYGEALSARAK